MKKDQDMDVDEEDMVTACTSCTENCQRKKAMGDTDHSPAFCRFFKKEPNSTFLTIPSPFAKKYKDRLDVNVVLEGPTGQIWAVSYDKKNARFTEGWDQFVNDNEFCGGELLQFEMNYASYFQVTIFEPQGFQRESQFNVDEGSFKLEEYSVRYQPA